MPDDKGQSRLAAKADSEPPPRLTGSDAGQSTLNFGARLATLAVTVGAFDLD